MLHKPYIRWRWLNKSKDTSDTDNSNLKLWFLMKYDPSIIIEKINLVIAATQVIVAWKFMFRSYWRNLIIKVLNTTEFSLSHPQIVKIKSSIMKQCFLELCMSIMKNVCQLSSGHDTKLSTFHYIMVQTVVDRTKHPELH